MIIVIILANIATNCSTLQAIVGLGNWDGCVVIPQRNSVEPDYENNANGKTNGKIKLKY